MESLFFYAFAAIAVISAILLVSFRNPVYSALSLVATLFALAGLFVLLQAYFLAAVQIIVYAGAIMVLFLFVIMLLNLGHSDALEFTAGRYRKASVVLLSALLVVYLGFSISGHSGAHRAPEDADLFAQNVPYIGKLLYTDFFLPFEIVSMVLLVALVGVMVLVKRDAIEADESGQA